MPHITDVFSNWKSIPLPQQRREKRKQILQCVKEREVFRTNQSRKNGWVFFLTRRKYRAGVVVYSGIKINARFFKTRKQCEIRTMGVYFKIVAFVFLATILAHSLSDCEVLTLGILLPFDNLGNFEAHNLKLAKYYAGIIPYTIDLINKNKSILPNHNLTYIWRDTSCTIDNGLQGIAEQWKKGVDVLIGLGCNCEEPVRLASALGLPVISNVSINVIGCSLLHVPGICNGKRLYYEIKMLCYVGCVLSIKSKS